MKVYLTRRQGFNIKQQQMVPPGRGQISPHIAYKAARVQTPARRRRGATGLAQVTKEGWNAEGKSRLGCSPRDVFTPCCLLFKAAKGFNQERMGHGHMFKMLVNV